jgi:NADH:ubiquinone oxidoreductase subunit 4 (subunit M)
MTQVLAWVLGGVNLIGALAAFRQTTPSDARRIAVVASTIVLFAAIASVVGLSFAGMESGPLRLRYVLPAIAMVGLIAAAMAPVTRHRVPTFARLLLLIGLSFTIVAATQLWLVAVLWAATALVPWFELRSSTQSQGTARLFSVYHVASVACFVVAATLLGSGQAHAAVIPLLVALAVREALLPVHSWFPRFVQQAPMAIVVAFTATQLGVWVHLDWLAPHIPHEYAHQVARVGAATAVIGGALGVVQTNARRALAYLFLSQTALLAFGVENESAVAQTGTVVNGIVQCLAFAGFAMTLSALEARRGAATLTVPSGNFAKTPKLAVAFLVMGFASVGLPLTLGFVSEDLLVQGSVHEFPRLGISLIVATALNGMNVARAFFLLFMGTDEDSGERDLTPREFVTMTIVMGTLFICGLFPGLVLRGLGGVYH